MPKTSWRQRICATVCWVGLAWGVIGLVTAAICAGYATIAISKAWTALVIPFALEGVIATAVGLAARAYARKQSWSLNLFRI